MTFKLPSSVSTPEQLEAFAWELQQHLDWHQNHQARQKVGAKGHPVEPTFSADIVPLVAAWQEKRPVTAATLSELLTTVRHLSKTLPVVHLTLTSIPDLDVRQELIEWLRTNIAPDVLVSFSVDRTLVGGAVIRTPNHIYDYSFRELLLAKKDRLPELIRNAR